MAHAFANRIVWWEMEINLFRVPVYYGPSVPHPWSPHCDWWGVKPRKPPKSGPGFDGAVPVVILVVFENGIWNNNTGTKMHIRTQTHKRTHSKKTTPSAPHNATKPFAAGYWKLRQPIFPQTKVLGWNVSGFVEVAMSKCEHTALQTPHQTPRWEFVSKVWTGVPHVFFLHFYREGLGSTVFSGIS